MTISPTTSPSLVEYAPAYPDWLDGEYESPLVGRIASIRNEILRRAGESSWILDEDQLTDQAIIRRMVLKRCIYGVDKNPLTVELAKVSLWLHSFTVGAPLSFLDHHLRCGDSLVGLRVTDAREDLRKLGGLLTASAVAGVETAADGMQQIEEMSDADVSEVRESAALFRNVEETTADLRGALDFLCGLRWHTAGMKRLDRMAREGIVSQNLGQQPDTAYTLLAHGPASVRGEPVPVRGEPVEPRPSPDPSTHHSERPPVIPGEAEESTPSSSAFKDLWTDATSIARRERFLHWEAAFPGVWRGWQDQRPEGGFDAVIGNPPWDRIKLQEVEWFATRDPELARAPTAAARKAAIKKLRQQAAAATRHSRESGNPPPPNTLPPESQTGSATTESAPDPQSQIDNPQSLVADFDAAKQRADKLGQLVRASGHYPLLGGGDINLYSLFVERAMSLTKPDGLVSLLTPSGIYAGKTAARFFKSVSTKGRVSGLFDFENRKIFFFRDVHASEKFCAFIFGGDERRFDRTDCAFFLHDVTTIDDRDRCFPLTPGDYDRRFGAVTARELVRDHVLRLTYTAHDMAPFARDLGCDGSPFTWDEEERRHLRARLDALYFHLYGLGRDDARYVLETFPIVRREDEKAFGRYRTRDLILAYMNALRAGDTQSVVAVSARVPSRKRAVREPPLRGAHLLGSCRVHGFEGHHSKSTPTFSRTSPTTRRGARQAKRARRARQSRLFSWSARTTPETALWDGRRTSKGYPLTLDVIGQRSARLVFRL